jgi:hypothetical protein
MTWQAVDLFQLRILLLRACVSWSSRRMDTVGTDKLEIFKQRSEPQDKFPYVIRWSSDVMCTSRPASKPLLIHCSWPRRNVLCVFLFIFLSFSA